VRVARTGANHWHCGTTAQVPGTTHPECRP
jgi:hypothetical protein